MVKYIHTFYFFQCYFCGEVYYTRRIIKRKKCIRCRKSFSFYKARKIKTKLKMKEAVNLLQYIKERMGQEKEENFKSIVLALNKELEKRNR